MFFFNSKYILALSLILTIIFISCNDNEIKLLKETALTPKLCYLKDADHGHGIIYNLSYDSKNQLISIDGFPDFDRIVYESSLPKKAISSFDKTYYIGYDYDSKGALSLINFVGKDSRGKAFEFKSKVYTNTEKQIEKIDLLLPVFDEAIITKIEYDDNGNIKKIILVENGKNKTLLENLSFDDKNSPYINTPLSNMMSYFTIFSATIGGENTTYFQNKNNPISTKIYTDSGEILYTYQYEYLDNYPTKIKITRKTSGKVESYDENFVYTCK